MDIDKFGSGEAPGEIVNFEGHEAFNPDPLPPDLQINNELAMAHADALKAVAELKGVGRNVENPRMLIRPFIRKEAVLSSRIEGTRADLEDVYALEAGQEQTIDQPRRDDAREVINYVWATEHGLSELDSSRLDLELIKDLHEILMQDVRGNEKSPGEFRDGQNYIAEPGDNVEEARYVPPPAQHASVAIKQLANYIEGDWQFPPLIDLGLIHYQFETIHPFWDGNGRIGRLLVTLLMCDRGLLDEPFLYISAFFNRNRNQYIDKLYRVSAENAWEEWLLFFLDAIKIQANEAYIRSKEMLTLQEQYREMYQDRRSKTHLQLVDHLFTQPEITVKDAQEELDVSYPAANATVSQLVDDGVLTEITGKKRNRRFRATEVFDILREPLDNIQLRNKESKEYHQSNLNEFR
jgi:Fic family protein